MKEELLDSKKIDDAQYQVTSMGTSMGSDNIDKILEESRPIMDEVFEMDVNKV